MKRNQTTAIPILTALMVATIAIIGCSKGGNEQKGEIRSEVQNPSNLVKVLDGVTCHSSSNGCPQSEVNLIWQMCLKNGFQEKMPTQNVSSARGIQELVSENITEIKTRSEGKVINKTDANGIVTSETMNIVVPYEETRFLRGYCSGSEYILK